jgi:hypothetical protein
MRSRSKATDSSGPPRETRTPRPVELNDDAIHVCRVLARVIRKQAKKGSGPW